MEYDNNTKQIIVGVVVVLILAVAFYLYRLNTNNDSTPDIGGSDLNSDNIGSEIFDGIKEGSQAADKVVPNSNPFNENQNTNPFSGYKNPFGN